MRKFRTKPAHKKTGPNGQAKRYAIVGLCMFGTAAGLLAAFATSPAEAVTVNAALSAKADSWVALVAMGSVMASALAGITLVNRHFSPKLSRAHSQNFPTA